MNRLVCGVFMLALPALGACFQDPKQQRAAGPQFEYGFEEEIATVLSDVVVSSGIDSELRDRALEKLMEIAERRFSDDEIPALRGNPHDSTIAFTATSDDCVVLADTRDNRAHVRPSDSLTIAFDGVLSGTYRLLFKAHNPAAGTVRTPLSSGNYFVDFDVDGDAEFELPFKGEGELPAGVPFYPFALFKLDSPGCQPVDPPVYIRSFR